MKRRLVRLVRYFVERPVRLVAALAGVLALGVVVALAALALLGAGLKLPGRDDVTGVSAATTARPGSEPPATQQFLRGNRDYDADLILASLADDARAGLGAADARASLQAQMQAARTRGYHVEEISYVGGRDLPNGTSMQFYLVGFRASAQGSIEYVPYLFTLNPDGKIVRVQ